ncbi:ATP-dependent nuclease [Curtobacterium flaccumfaciens]|uniref:ATP-dependent nuclease n=1 Tax=Curtobacterium flaccumfaciens TaxID=2035 RepID=UPI00112D5EAE|nr:hypothetical protein [Curtobacterium flaccumfaciens]
MNRDAKAEKIWGKLDEDNRRPLLNSVQVGKNHLDLSSGCVILGGRNGVGKTRLLRSVGTLLGDDALYLDLHHLSEQAMILLRSRDDEEGAVEDVGVYTPSAETLDDLTRVIGRKYSLVEWADLELVPFEPEVAKAFEWDRGQSYVPYFRVTHHDRSYTGREMGLGEFTVHFLFWILEQYRDRGNLTLLLDEPDAFLPPIGIKALLQELLAVCVERKWQLILTTHADEMIRSAMDHNAFVLLSKDEDGDVTAHPVGENRHLASFLLARPPVERILYCEDESASFLIDSILRKSKLLSRKSFAIAWTGGNGELVALRSRIPHPARFAIQLTFVFDGDQWDKTTSVEGAWPARFLPTGGDPDAMFRDAVNAENLSARLDVPVEQIRAFLGSIEGQEDHDWTNKLGEEYGRNRTLAALADGWVSEHETECVEFARHLTTNEEFKLHSSQMKLQRQKANGNKNST